MPKYSPPHSLLVQLRTLHLLSFVPLYTLIQKVDQEHAGEIDREITGMLLTLLLIEYLKVRRLSVV